jgi:hypothetical protein
MTIASLCGFGIAAQFVSLEALEIPYYVALLGAASLAVHGRCERSEVMDTGSTEHLTEQPLHDWRDHIEEEGQQVESNEAVLIMN